MALGTVLELIWGDVGRLFDIVAYHLGNIIQAMNTRARNHT